MCLQAVLRALQDKMHESARTGETAEQCERSFECSEVVNILVAGAGFGGLVDSCIRAVSRVPGIKAQILALERNETALVHLNSKYARTSSSSGDSELEESKPTRCNTTVLAGDMRTADLSAFAPFDLIVRCGLCVFTKFLLNRAGQ